MYICIHGVLLVEGKSSHWSGEVPLGMVYFSPLLCVDLELFPILIYTKYFLGGG
jgi:hypothetical protein